MQIKCTYSQTLPREKKKLYLKKLKASPKGEVFLLCLKSSTLKYKNILLDLFVDDILNATIDEIQRDEVTD